MLASRKASLGLVAKLGDALDEKSDDRGTEKINGVSSEIRFDNVSFGYGRRQSRAPRRFRTV